MGLRQKYKNLKEITGEIINISKENSNYEKESKIFDIFILSLILINVLSLTFSTIKFYNIKYEIIFKSIEYVSVFIFSIEYLLRWWVYPYNKKEKNEYNFFKRIASKSIRYIFSPFAIIDLMAILPFYLPIYFKIDLRFLRILRMFRIIRLLKVGRYSISIRAIALVIKRKGSELVTLFGTMVILLILSSSLMYFLENPVQPEVFSSIPATMWWGVATLTTVGYGDVYPITVLGKLMASIIAILFIGIVALPSGILASGLIEEFDYLKGEVMENIKFKNHVLICGWNRYGKELIKNLISKDAQDAGIDNILILSEKEEGEINIDLENEKIYAIKGDPQKKENLMKKGDISTCHSVIILPDLDREKSDSESLLQVLTVNKLAPEKHISVMVIDSDLKEHFETADEIICLDDIGSKLTASSIITNGISKIFNELINFDIGNEIYKFKNIPEKYIDKTFFEMSNELLKRNIILIGIEEDSGKTLLNPSPKTKIKSSDELFLISENKDSINTFFKG